MSGFQSNRCFEQVPFSELDEPAHQIELNQAKTDWKGTAQW